ncbi:MAG: helix-turn-helix domain-containing protein [Anaerolineae bacterium]|nr:helix-turn-helix domain-containing protein [Anaerolineae bacterium]
MTTYLSAREAAAELGISLPTLYAYVSRGLIRSEAGEGPSRARRYRVEDITALKTRKEMRHRPEAAAETAVKTAVQTALHWGAPVLESAITLIDNGRLTYRGYDALTLPDAHTFADVANLIWRQELTTGAQFTADISPQWAPIAPLWPHIHQLALMERLQTVLPLAMAHDLAAYDWQSTAVYQTGQRILLLLATAVTGQPISGSIATALQQAWSPEDTKLTPLLESALIYCADHELNVSAFAARVVASARATPYAVVLAGLAALQGTLHGGATERVDAFLREVGTPDNARTAISARLRRGEPIPGFGHPLYPEGDARGRALLAKIAAVYPGAPGWQLAQQVMDEMATAVGRHPNIDFALVALAWAANLPPGAPLALFALGRTVGWLGHALEQIAQDQMIRPRARYVGPVAVIGNR